MFLVTAAILLLIVAHVGFLMFARSTAFKLYRSSKTLQPALTFSPQHLTKVEIASLFGIIFLKYFWSFLGRGVRLTPSDADTGFVLPELRIDAPLVVDEKDVRAFEVAVCQASDSSELQERVNTVGEDSPNGIFLLAALTTPVMLFLLASHRCPVLPFGSVNTRNRFEFLDPDACRNLSGKKMVVHAQFGGSERMGRRVKRGMEFDVIVEVMMVGDGTSKPIFRQVITVLQFLAARMKPLFQEEKKVAKENGEGAPYDLTIDTLTLSNNTPSTWAAVCKDYNPIHISSIAARMFGFPGKIAHGNHVVALTMERKSGKSDPNHQSFARLWWESNQPSYLQVEFRRPMALPTELSIVIQSGQPPDEQEIGFEIQKKGKVHVAGQARVL